MEALLQQYGKNLDRAPWAAGGSCDDTHIDAATVVGTMLISQANQSLVQTMSVLEEDIVSPEASRHFAEMHHPGIRRVWDVRKVFCQVDDPPALPLIMYAPRDHVDAVATVTELLKEQVFSFRDVRVDIVPLVRYIYTHRADRRIGCGSPNLYATMRLAYGPDYSNDGRSDADDPREALLSQAFATARRLCLIPDGHRFRVLRFPGARNAIMGAVDVNLLKVRNRGLMLYTDPEPTDMTVEKAAQLVGEHYVDESGHEKLAQSAWVALIAMGMTVPTLSRTGTASCAAQAATPLDEVCGWTEISDNLQYRHMDPRIHLNENSGGAMIPADSSCFLVARIDISSVAAAHTIDMIVYTVSGTHVLARVLCERSADNRFHVTAKCTDGSTVHVGSGGGLSTSRSNSGMDMLQLKRRVFMCRRIAQVQSTARHPGSHSDLRSNTHVIRDARVAEDAVVTSGTSGCDTDQDAHVSPEGNEKTVSEQAQRLGSGRKRDSHVVQSDASKSVQPARQRRKVNSPSKVTKACHGGINAVRARLCRGRHSHGHCDGPHQEKDKGGANHSGKDSASDDDDGANHNDKDIVPDDAVDNEGFDICCLACNEPTNYVNDPLMKCDAIGDGTDPNKEFCPHVTHVKCSGFDREPAWYFCDTCATELYAAHKFYHKAYNKHLKKKTVQQWVVGLAKALQLGDTTIRDWIKYDVGDTYQPKNRKGSLLTNQKFLALYRERVSTQTDTGTDGK